MCAATGQIHIYSATKSYSAFLQTSQADEETHCCLMRLRTFCSLDQCMTLLWCTGVSVCTI